MIKTLLTIGTAGMILALAACQNPDDRFAQARTVQAPR